MNRDDPACAALHDRLDDATSEGALDGLARALAGHLGACGACAELVDRQRRLVRLLTEVPDAPSVALAPPALPDRPGGRLVPFPTWVAAAAAAAACLVIALRVLPGPADRVRVDHVVDVAGAPPPVDERLLALTAGSEAVAMRRPTELR